MQLFGAHDEDDDIVISMPKTKKIRTLFPSLVKKKQDPPSPVSSEPLAPSLMHVKESSLEDLFNEVEKAIEQSSTTVTAAAVAPAPVIMSEQEEEEEYGPEPEQEQEEEEDEESEYEEETLVLPSDSIASSVLDEHQQNHRQQQQQEQLTSNVELELSSDQPMNTEMSMLAQLESDMVSFKLPESGEYYHLSAKDVLKKAPNSVFARMVNEHLGLIEKSSIGSNSGLYHHDSSDGTVVLEYQSEFYKVMFEYLRPVAAVTAVAGDAAKQPLKTILTPPDSKSTSSIVSSGFGRSKSYSMMMQEFSGLKYDSEMTYEQNEKLKADFKRFALPLGHGWHVCHAIHSQTAEISQEFKALSQYFGRLTMEMMLAIISRFMDVYRYLPVEMVFQVNKHMSMPQLEMTYEFYRDIYQDSGEPLDKDSPFRLSTERVIEDDDEMMETVVACLFSENRFEHLMRRTAAYMEYNGMGKVDYEWTHPGIVSIRVLFSKGLLRCIRP